VGFVAFAKEAKARRCRDAEGSNDLGKTDSLSIFRPGYGGLFKFILKKRELKKGKAVSNV